MIGFVSRLGGIFLAGMSLSFAGGLGPLCNNEDVTFPCEQSAWAFGVDFPYLQSRIPALGYYGSSVPERKADKQFNHLTYDWNWGFKLQGSYYFNTGNSIDVNWYHFTNSQTTALPNNLNDPFQNKLTQDVTGSNNPRWDEVDADFGQRIDLSKRSELKIYAGVEYVRVRFSGGYSAQGLINPSVNFSGNVAVLRDIIFNGFGPRIGANLLYGKIYGFSGYVQTATSALIGQSSFHRKLIYGQSVMITKGQNDAIVPELQLKAGIQFIYPMAQSDLIIDGGWFFTNYFHIMHEGVASGVVHLSDFSIQGPYIGLRWIGSTS